MYDFSWCDDFAAARNFSFSKATKDYIYAPDADEDIDEEQEGVDIEDEAILDDVEALEDIEDDLDDDMDDLTILGEDELEDEENE